MAPERETPSPHVFVLFGATGDLARRKLFPGFYQLAAASRLPDDYVIIGSGRHSPGADDEFRDTIRTALTDSIEDVDEAVLADLLSRLTFRVSDADDGSDLATAVEEARADLGDDVETLIYLSVPPSAMEPMIGMLGREEITEGSRIVIEKPFGTDLSSSRDLDAAIKQVATEEQVFRIDHFLGKEAVQNILALRFANGLIEPAWNRTHVESVQIDVPEELTVEGRGSFYEATGCLRDMISTHLCQVLGFVAMEPPVQLDARSLRDEKAKVFAAMRPLDPDQVVFGQYDGYRDEDDVADDSQVETFVALEAYVDTERWQGVPFHLRTGKALGATRRTITLRFRIPPMQRFGDETYGPNELVLELTDSPRISVDLYAKRPGPTMSLMSSTLQLDLAEEDPEDEPLEAYERLLLDVMHGDQTLFTRSDEVDRLWQICEPVLSSPPATLPYERGSWGPDEALACPGSSAGGSRMPDRRPVGLAIAEHGLIGDLRTSALVGVDGTIDWFCAPRFDSPSIFGAILDPEEGGAWTLAPRDGAIRTHQFYIPDSAILATRFSTESGVVEVHDFMPVLQAGDPEHRQRIVRRVVAVRGTTAIAMRLDARPDYARARCATEVDDDGVLLTADGVRLGLTSTVDLVTDGGVVSADVQLTTGESALFVLEVLDEDAPFTGDGLADSRTLFDATAAFWRGWLARSTYTGRWREMVDRSAITLKLLTHEPTGAIIAAPTTSLPEVPGGDRNWDYRFVWVRDAAFSLYALLRLGFTDEANAFVSWLSSRLGEERDDDHGLGPLRVMYDIDGAAPVDEYELDHLAGHLGSKPVRVGNGAVDQLQLDIYGELIDSVYLFNKHGAGISSDAWADVTRVVDWLCDNWDRDDAGMWEVRSGLRPHTTSRIMSWVAIERTIRMARQRGLPGDISAWAGVRDAIYERIMASSWNDELQAFTQVEGGDALDAGVLLMPMVKLLSPADPKFVSTLAAIEERLVVDSLVFRYDPDLSPDGLDGDEGTFSLCSFWYVEALTRVGRLEDARLALEKMFTYANHVGLYAEEISATGEQLGNFPQAFTHLALISAAINLDRALDE